MVHHDPASKQKLNQFSKKNLTFQSKLEFFKQTVSQKLSLLQKLEFSKGKVEFLPVVELSEMLGREVQPSSQIRYPINL